MRILFINIPPFSTKKSGNDLYWLQSSMNLGLLSVASTAADQGHDVNVYDWLGPHQFPLLNELATILDTHSPQVVGLSMPSGYGEAYCGPITSYVKDVLPDATIVVGGQYHAGTRWRRLLKRYPAIDAVCLGDGDGLNWSKVAEIKRGKVIAGLASRYGFGGHIRSVFSRRLDFTLNRLRLADYAPSVEFSRGCPFACSFCSISGMPTQLERFRPETLSEQINFWVDFWPNLERVPLYFECPVLFLNQHSIDMLRKSLAAFSDHIAWRVQTRVDSVTPEIMQQLYTLGLRVIDLGLESAAPHMLHLMGKTPNPTQYLMKAEQLLAAAADAGVAIKVNILLYPGETESTAAQTEDFILRNETRIAGVSAASALEFPGTSLSSQLPEYYTRYGTRRRKVDPTLSGTGIYPLDLSRDFPLEKARAWCLRLTRAVMTPESYFKLKHIGYFPPMLSFDQMLRYARRAESAALPFVLPECNGSLSFQYDTIDWDQLR